MERWSEKAIIKFHEEYEGDYAGDTSSLEIVRLSKKHIGNKVLDVGAGSGALIIACAGNDNFKKIVEKISENIEMK